MTRLIRLSVLLIFALSLTAITARLVGRQQLMLMVALFTYPDGSSCVRPCLMGIQPDATPLEEAMSLIQAHPLTRELHMHLLKDGGRVAFQGHGVYVNLVPGVGQRVSYISLRFSPEDLTEDSAMIPLLHGMSLGQVIATLGEPRHFYLTGRPTAGATWFYYQDDGLAIQTRRVGSGTLSMDDMLVGLFVSTRWPDAALDSIWRGFSSMVRYSSGPGRTQ